jgi:hypothetical protein
MSTLRVNTIANTAGVTNNRVLQIQSTQVSTRSSQTITNDVLAEITGMSVSITPLFSNSKILLQAQWMGEFNSHSISYNSIFSFKRNDTYLGSSDEGDSRFYGIMPPAISLTANAASTPESSFLMYMDTPATTSAITYKLSIISTGGTVYNNRTVTDNNENGYERGMSMITATEIAQ